jgi:hypothetical protein
MKRLPLLLVLALLTILVAAPSVQAAKPSVFVGSWTSNDPAPPDGDGSTLYLTISAGTTVSVTFIDAYGTICTRSELGYDAPTNWFSSRLTGTVVGNDLFTEWVTARCGPLVFPTGEWGPGPTWTYDSGTNTLWDGSVTWHRL